MTAVLWSTALVRIVLAQLAFGFSWCLYLVYPKFLATELGVGPAQIGSVALVANLTSAMAVLVLAHAIDRSRRAVFVAGCALLAAASIGFLFVQRFGPAVYLLQAGVAASYMLAFNAAMASVTDVAPPSRLGQAFGLQSAANLAMNAVSTVTAEHLAQLYGWRSVFAVAAGSSLLALLLGFGIPSTPPHTRAQASAASPPYGALLPVFLTAAMLGATYVALATFHQPYALSLGTRQVSSFFVGFTVAALTVRLGFGNVGDRYGRGPVALACHALYAVVVISMLAFDVSRLWLHGAVFGLAHGVLYPTLIAFATERAPAGTQGRTIAAFSGAFYVGMAAGAATWGALSAQRGYPSVYIGALLCVVVGSGALFATAKRAPRAASSL